MRRIIALLVLASMFHFIYVASTVGASFDVGQHIHVMVHDHPVDGHPVAKTIHNYAVTITLHDFPAGVRLLRVARESTVVAQRTFSPPLTCIIATCTFQTSLSVDMRGWSSGSHELRWTADSKDSDPGLAGTQRQYTTSRFQVCVAACSPAYRKSPFLGGGSWYTDHGYVVPLIKSSDTAIRPGGVIAIKSEYSGATICAFLNPDFHHGSHGQALGCTPTVTIPASAHPGDSLVVVARDKNEAGVLKVPLGNGSSRSTWDIETQSWWSHSGLVMP